jgi:hypothetical protein
LPKVQDNGAWLKQNDVYFFIDPLPVSQPPIIKDTSKVLILVA